MNPTDRSGWITFDTADLDEAHAHMSAAYLKIRVDSSVPSPGFAMRTQIAGLGDAAVSRARYRARTRLTTELFEDPCFVQLTSGGYGVAGPLESYAPVTGGALLLLPHQRLELHVDDFELSTVILPWKLVQGVADGLADVPAGTTVRFESARPVSAPLERHWVSSVAYVQRAILNHPDLAVNALIVGQARRLLAATALTVFPNTTMRLEAEPAGEAGRSAVRRAVAFIDANPARDLTAADIAEAARIAVPALVQAFRAHLGTSPTAYLRRTRMEHAHRDLSAGDVQNASVSEVARRWGFLDPRRFATEYRRAYGRSPSETLRS